MKQYDYAIVCDASPAAASTQMRFRSVGMSTHVLITHQSVRDEMCNSSFRVVVRGWDRCGLSSAAMTNSLEYLSHETPRILAVLDGDRADDDEDFSSNQSISATALIENCGPFCTFRCGLGVFPFGSTVAELSANWASPWAESEDVDAIISMVQYGDETVMLSSNGTVIDWTPPVSSSPIKVGVDDLVSSNGPIFTTSNSSLSVSWTEFQEPESGPLSLWIAIATSCDAARLPINHSRQ
eukprot:3018464-Rhodomonas_salina.1